MSDERLKFLASGPALRGKKSSIDVYFPADEICLKRELIVATRELRFPEFSGDGEYLVHYTIDQLVKTTGKPEDDLSNTFTARLLLLLESRPLIEPFIYWQAIDAVIEKYWRNYSG